jgi:hypothetical protein
VLPSAFGEGAAVRGAAALTLRRVLDAPWAVPAARTFAGESDPVWSEPQRAKEVAIGRR